MATIERSTPFRFTAMKLTDTNQLDFEEFIRTYPSGDASLRYDENNNYAVIVGLDKDQNEILQTVNSGDWITKLFSRWWTVIPDAEFTDDYTIV